MTGKMIKSQKASFYPAWVSTIDHLKTFSRITSQASLVKKMLGSYSMPPDFPYVHMWWGIFPFFRIPLVMFASGSLTVSDEAVHFESRSWGDLQLLGGNRYKNLKATFNFEMSLREILQIEQYKNPSPFMSYYDLDWTRMITSREGLLGDILIGIGGTGPTMGKIRRQNAELFSTIKYLVDNSHSTNHKVVG